MKMNGKIQTSEEQQLREREKYVMAFNDTMIRIWKERITLLNVVDTGQLLNSVTQLHTRADGKFLNIELSQHFLTYGIWQDRGVGGEVYRGNPGDIGRVKKRKAKPWFSKKYYASVMKLREFYADNIGKQFLGVVSDALDIRKLAKDNW